MQKLKSYIIGFTIFLIPTFFLPITHEFYNINKFILLSISVIVLISISALELIQTHKVRWSKNAIRLLFPVCLFVLGVLLSTFLRSQNTIQSFFDLSYGPLLLITLALFFWYVAGDENKYIIDILLRFGAAYLSMITIALMAHPFSFVTLPRVFQFLKTDQFTPIGTQIDLLVYLGFISIYQIHHLIKERKSTSRTSIFGTVGLIISLLALVLTLSNTISTTQLNKVPTTAPLSLSMKVSTKTLRSPVSFFLGDGIGSFGTTLTQVKDGAYNSTPYWSQSSFENASSALLKVIAESGVFSTIALLSIFMFGFLFNDKVRSSALLIYTAIIFFVVPASFILFFILFLSLSLSIGRQESDHTKVTQRLTGTTSVGAMIMTMVIIGATWLGFILYIIPLYRAEVAMRNAVEAIANNNLQRLYDQQRQAVLLNPYIERYRLNFSQTNIFIAKQFAAKSNPNQTIITQSVQRAINEAQTAVSLNSNRAANWENLGTIYQNVLGVKGAEQWAIAAFQRAILLDPQNVSYRLELGGVFYSIKQYGNAAESFRQAILLKPDLPNSYYNLAYAYYQDQNREKAVETMDSLLILLKRQSSPNYQKALTERQEFASGTAQKQAPSVLQ